MSPDDLAAAGIPQIERPHPSLFTYYILSSLVAGPFFPFVLLPLLFRFHTMRYRFTEQGVSMSWGVLFHKEINLTYARIQDIHLVSNVVERWLGLARIQIQTASGSAKAEMTIEGVRSFRELRDFLYGRMRGVRALRAGAPHPSRATNVETSPGIDATQEVGAALREAAAELRALREALASRGGHGRG